MASYWIIVGSPDNFEKTKEHGFGVQGMKSRHRRKAEHYPWRVPIRKEVVLPRERWVPAEGLARKLAYVSKWPPEHWRLAFQGNVHEIPEGDFELIRAEIDKAASEAA